MRIAVTGANGFVGRALCIALRARGVSVIPLVRRECGLPGEIVIDDPTDSPSARICIPQADALIHLAAKSTDTGTIGEAMEATFRRANVDFTSRVLEACREAGVRKFLLMSSVKVNGEETVSGIPFRESDMPAPVDAYGASKYEAETLVRAFCWNHDINWTIVRAPLIYGAKVKGNFRRLIRLAQSGVPLPIGLANNRRSLISIGNLSDFLCHCILSQKANNAVFLVSDDEAISTKELIRRVAAASGHRVVVFPFPLKVLELVTSAIRREGLYRRLFGNLEIDSSWARTHLGWQPPFNLDEALREMIANDPQC